MKITVLLSGGIDSAVCLYLARRAWSDVVAVSVDYSQPNSTELRFASRMAERAGVPWQLLSARAWTLEGGGAYWGRPVVDGDPMITPHRNAVLIALAAAATQPNEIWLGCNADDQADYPDCRPEFTEELGLALDLTINLPLCDLTKREVVETARALGVPLEETLSCYRGQHPGCGTCNACVLRESAL